MMIVYLVIDDTDKKLVSDSSSIVVAVEDARFHNETTKHKVQLYSAELMVEMPEAEREI